MSKSLPNLRRRLSRVWRWIRAPVWLALGLLVGFGVPYGVALDRLVRTEFAQLRWSLPSRVYARPLWLAPGLPLTADALERELKAARFLAVQAPLTPGTYARNGSKWTLATRGFSGAHGPVAPRRITLELAGGRVRAIADANSGAKLTEALVDPARIATLYGPRQEERRYVRLRDVPPLLVATLQAVEDRDFKHHHGVDPLAILRAAWANLRSGAVVQGGSTLTQQLVRNLFLDRSQTITRKLNEAALALLIEARFDKARILEAYVNAVYLGQQGAQAVHGFAAASEFWFGRELRALDAAEMALLVGLIQGPSLHDPRRFPERALARRNVVLKMMHDTGLITTADRALAARRGLGVTAAGALPRNRHPAFLDRVRRELASEFPDAVLRSEGLTILTTLAPATQEYAEQAIAARFAAMGKGGADLEAAAVVAHSRTGAVEAVVGGRDPDEPGFNRALDAVRPIGSLVKPFVYLIALAQPEAWSLMSPLEDRAVHLRLANGKTWSPTNSDKIEHGDVPLVDALARSYNLASVRLGLDVGVERVERVLEALIPGANVGAKPSLLLGAIDLSPFQVAQAFEYLAADGHPLPLYAVEAVNDATGKALIRHAPAPAAGDLVAAARRVTYALQETARGGTAHALVGLGLGRLGTAGKTGTSNDQRDSWFAGYTGTHLAVVWLGADDNRKTTLYGSTGALRVWAALFEKLPTEPLELDLRDDPQMAWVDPQAQTLTDASCPGARQLPFIRGFEPVDTDSCFGARFRGWFDRDDEYETRPERDAERQRWFDWSRRKDERDDETL